MAEQFKFDDEIRKLKFVLDQEMCAWRGSDSVTVYQFNARQRNKGFAGRVQVLAYEILGKRQYELAYNLRFPSNVTVSDKKTGTDLEGLFEGLQRTVQVEL